VLTHALLLDRRILEVHSVAAPRSCVERTRKHPLDPKERARWTSAARPKPCWGRSLGGALPCTLRALRAVGAHPRLRGSKYAGAAIAYVQRARRQSGGRPVFKGRMALAMLQSLAAFPVPAAFEIIRTTLTALAPRQRRNGTFGGPQRLQRVVAVLVALRSVEEAGRWNWPPHERIRRLRGARSTLAG
jgi:hypothetical protein